jgi:hypothetical protein
MTSLFIAKANLFEENLRTQWLKNGRAGIEGNSTLLPPHDKELHILFWFWAVDEYVPCPYIFHV